MSNTNDYDAELMKISFFDGRNSKWREWSSKFLVIAATRGYREVLLGKESAPPGRKTTLTVEEARIKKANTDAYNSLILACTGTAFGAVDSAKTKEQPEGDAKLAWSHLCA